MKATETLTIEFNLFNIEEVKAFLEILEENQGRKMVVERGWDNGKNIVQIHRDRKGRSK